jgi:hypothetical protein
MKLDWGYLTIIAVMLCATIAYVFRDGSDPWVMGFVISVPILIGKAVIWFHANDPEKG